MVTNHKQDESGSNDSNSEQGDTGCEVCNQIENIRNLERFERRNALKKRIRVRSPRDLIAGLIVFIGLIGSLMTIDQWIQARTVPAKTHVSQSVSCKGK